MVRPFPESWTTARTLEELDPQWPVADFDVEEMKKALVATGEDAPA